jgi:hypothetical protein
VRDPSYHYFAAYSVGSAAAADFQALLEDSQTAVGPEACSCAAHAIIGDEKKNVLVGMCGMDACQKNWRASYLGGPCGMNPGG